MPLQFWSVVVVPVAVVAVKVVFVLVADVVVSVVVVDVAVVVEMVIVVAVAVDDVMLCVVVVVVEDAVAVVSVGAVNVLVVVVAVVVVQVWHMPGQLFPAASRIKAFGLSQFLRRNPGVRHPIGSGKPLHDGSVHVLHVTGHWMRTASAGLPSALQSDLSTKQESGSKSGSPLQVGVVVVVVTVLSVVVVVAAAVELMQLLHRTGHAALSWVATAATGVLQNSSGTEQIPTGSCCPLQTRDGSDGVSGHELHRIGHSDETLRPSSVALPQKTIKFSEQNSGLSTFPKQVLAVVGVVVSVEAAAVVVGQLLHSTGQASRAAVPRSGSVQTFFFCARVAHSTGSSLPLQGVGGSVGAVGAGGAVGVLVDVDLKDVAIADVVVEEEDVDDDVDADCVGGVSGQVSHNTGHNF